MWPRRCLAFFGCSPCVSRRCTRALSLLTSLALGACEAGTADSARVAAESHEIDQEKPEKIEEIEEIEKTEEIEKGPEARLLGDLAQGHRQARRHLGRHRLRYTADFSLTPADPAAARGSPPEGARWGEVQATHDELTLEWAADDDRSPALALSQGPDEAGARALRILGDTAYSRLPHRGWFSRPVDSELHWRLADDAERCVHDLLRFAGPSLAIEAVTAAAEREVITVGLRPGSTAAAAPGIVLREVEGTVELDAEHRLWLAATVAVEFTATDPEGRTLTGRATLVAEREATPTLTLGPPETSAPLPERERYEVERRRLLDGLHR